MISNIVSIHRILAINEEKARKGH